MSVLQVMLPGCPGGILHACHSACILEWLSGWVFFHLNKQMQNVIFIFLDAKASLELTLGSGLVGRLVVWIISPEMENVQTVQTRLCFFSPWLC